MSTDPWAPSTDNTPDPWATTTDAAPATPAAQEAPPVSDASVVASDRHPFSVKLTLKANESYNAEWINPWISGATAEECARNTVQMIHALAEYKVIDLVASTADYTRKQYKGGVPAAAPSNGGGSYQSQNRPQQSNSLPPGIEPRSCQHGEMVYRTGNGNYGPYQAFFCPTPKGAPDKCKAIYLK